MVRLPYKFLLAVSLAVASLTAFAQTHDAVTDAVQSIVAQHHGTVAVYAHQLNTGKTVAIDADNPVQTASTIKLAMLWTSLREIGLGACRMG